MSENRYWRVYPFMMCAVNIRYDVHTLNYNTVHRTTLVVPVTFHKSRVRRTARATMQNTSRLRAVYYSVPARLGKGQRAKEIEHNLARERPKFGHNNYLVRKRHKIFYAWTTKIWSCGRLMKTWPQICKRFTSIFTSAVWKHKNSNYIL